MVYYLVSFGNNSRTYLYKAKNLELDLGYMVDVPVKEKDIKKGIIVAVYNTYPVHLGILEEKVKFIVGRNYEPVDVDWIERILLGLQESYYRGHISRDVFCYVVEGMVSKQELLLEKEHWLYSIVFEDIPEMELYYVWEPGNEDDKEFGFRKAFKEFQRKLRLRGNKPMERTHVIHYDPIEDEERFQRIELDVERKLDEELGYDVPYMGFCHKYWHRKKQILKEEYGIDWKSPADMNPMMCFD